MPTTTFDLKELPSRLAEAITSATVGADLLIVDNQAPIARVVLCPPGRARIAGLHPGTMDVAEDFDEPLSEDFWMGAP